MSDGDTSHNVDPPLETYDAPPASEGIGVGPRIVPRSTGARVPPHNSEAEQSVLGAVLISSDAANAVLDKLDAEDFYEPPYQSIYECVQELYNANQPIDAITVTNQLRRKGQLERVGGLRVVTELSDAVPVASRVEYYADIVEENALRRRLLAAGGVVADWALNTEEEIDQVVDAAEQTVYAVAERRVGDGLQAVSNSLSSTIEMIEAMGANSSEITGLATGFRDLDRKLAGLQPANLVIIAARPAMGKSALGLNIASNVAIRGGTVAVFSMEMGKEEIIQRLLCSVGRVDSMKLRSGQLDQRQWQGVVGAAGKLFEAPIYIDDSASITVTDIRAKTRRLKRQRGLDLILVDYLQLMQGRNRENRQQEISEISRSLKNLARELNIPIVAMSQLNRSLEAREDKRPKLGDLRESGAIEQDADIVMFIYRHEYYYPDDMESKGLAEVAVAKHRSGSTGKVDLTFLPEFTLFSDLGRDLAS
jgi:replicative DNA helicase